MSDFTLTRTGIRAGEYEGVLTTRLKHATAPNLELRLLGNAVAEVNVIPELKTKNRWNIRAAIPASMIDEGVQTFLIQNRDTGETLDSFAIVAGQPLEEDLRADIALLRAELEILKRAFRKHCRDAPA